MCIVISSAIIESNNNYHINDRLNYTITSFNEKSFLLNRLFELYIELGVTGYEEFQNGNVKWLFENNWYNTDQLNRIRNMKGFI